MTADLPCLTCTALQAVDVRHAIGQGALDSTIDGSNKNKSPSGLPLMCCRIRTVGMAPESQPAVVSF